MTHRAIPLPQGLMYIYMFVSLTRVFVVYVVKEVASFRGARELSQLKRVVHKITHGSTYSL